ncbi:hypothetical protein [Urbifossiella limnaea]|uniref:PSP1 C-terminal domain-containing protein n=1 Tax=Urbifossiella limnaea TaxID=2528023 RepID=A0A517Y2F3_9BACT|nr:hypothetical protein [Urbifossiella limnaea]QDU23963.1 hypothetical protein ETAA1_59740 [Urbifossiella limnaea]
MTAALLVQYGRPGYVGRFRASVEAVRGACVVLRGPRGLELGTVLCAAVAGVSGIDDEGELLRAATAADEAAADRSAALARDLLAAADELAAGLPVAFPDAEVALDGTAAVLHALPWAGCDLDAVLVALSERFGLPVRLLDLSRTPANPDPPEPATSCGKPDCGSGAGGCGTGGGCSTGSCSRGAVKSATELTAYFADLRGQMEAAARVPLH